MLGHSFESVGARLCQVAVVVYAIAFSAMSVAQENPPVFARDTEEAGVGHARMFFARHDYQKAIIALKGEAKSLEAQWILAESLFQLHMYAKSKEYFSQILQESDQRIDKEKASGRLFEIELFLKNIDGAIHRFVAFEKEFNKAPGRMAYAMGKELYDIDYLDHSKEILEKIPQGDEYFMRARYIVAAMGLNKRSAKESIELFDKIEKSTLISTEDYWVHDLAKLAKARILADNGQEKLAVRAYMNVSLTGAFGEVATTELIKLCMLQRELARLGVNGFKNMSAKKRESIASEALDSALHAIFRLQKVQKITWRTPELLSLMASLMVEAKRYDDARIAYDELIGHFRPIRALLMSNIPRHELWPYFAIDYERSPKMTSLSLPLIGGIPASLVRGLADVKDIISLRDRIEESGRKLVRLEEDTVRLSLNVDNKDLSKARLAQIAIENDYRAMVINKQGTFKNEVAQILGSFLAEAEYKRADLVIAEMRHLEKQLGVVQDFNRKNIDMFETRLKALDAGETP